MVRRRTLLLGSIYPIGTSHMWKDLSVIGTRAYLLCRPYVIPTGGATNLSASYHLADQFSTIPRAENAYLYLSSIENKHSGGASPYLDPSLSSKERETSSGDVSVPYSNPLVYSSLYTNIFLNADKCEYISKVKRQTKVNIHITPSGNQMLWRITGDAADVAEASQMVNTRMKYIQEDFSIHSATYPVFAVNIFAFPTRELQNLLQNFRVTVHVEQRGDTCEVSLASLDNSFGGAVESIKSVVDGLTANSVEINLPVKASVFNDQFSLKQFQRVTSSYVFIHGPKVIIYGDDKQSVDRALQIIKKNVSGETYTFKLPRIMCSILHHELPEIRRELKSLPGAKIFMSGYSGYRLQCEGSQLVEARALLERKLAKYTSNSQLFKTSKVHAKLLLGKGGSKLASIQQYSGAFIESDEGTETETWKVYADTAEKVNKALHALKLHRNLLEETALNLRVPQWCIDALTLDNPHFLKSLAAKAKCFLSECEGFTISVLSHHLKAVKHFERLLREQLRLVATVEEMVTPPNIFRDELSSVGNWIQGGKLQVYGKPAEVARARAVDTLILKQCRHVSVPTYLGKALFGHKVQSLQEFADSTCTRIALRRNKRSFELSVFAPETKDLEKALHLLDFRQAVARHTAEKVLVPPKIQRLLKGFRSSKLVQIQSSTLTSFLLDGDFIEIYGTSKEAVLQAKTLLRQIVDLVQTSSRMDTQISPVWIELFTGVDVYRAKLHAIEQTTQTCIMFQKQGLDVMAIYGLSLQSMEAQRQVAAFLADLKPQCQTFTVSQGINDSDELAYHSAKFRVIEQLYDVQIFVSKRFTSDEAIGFIIGGRADVDLQEALRMLAAT
ncbi:hypothetical protein BABINDRAFT_80412 [Babjeviella inositovora NRRL Y-12698]|uniref:K Homology domain-containing protein n=1 Tax=Babjeviella inositovora NRRL Y-12698 TaxID=984486 RepID=A0A1E3QZK2_9ASCO|nr:uncharacterized protein BABINDRAFT_80412 [Babjeviella inositovora NRRL Y-12698]ODQ83068.1 hypothetical protein BABINDRAFT_80412 [Babjeviella inositovora NRRL Y-12698]